MPKRLAEPVTEIVGTAITVPASDLAWSVEDEPLKPIHPLPMQPLGTRSWKAVAVAASLVAGVGLVFLGIAIGWVIHPDTVYYDPNHLPPPISSVDGLWPPYTQTQTGR